MSKIIVPGQKPKVHVETKFEIFFKFDPKDGFDKVADQLDKTLMSERDKAIEALAKFFGGKVEFEKNEPSK